MGLSVFNKKSVHIFLYRGTSRNPEFVQLLYEGNADPLQTEACAKWSARREINTAALAFEMQAPDFHAMQQLDEMRIAGDSRKG